MSRNHGKNPKVDLKLNLSAKQLRARGGPSTRAVIEEEEEDNESWSSPSISPTSSPEAISMVLAGCPHCLMYVMLSNKDPKCPRCKSTVLLDFPRGNTTAGRNRKS
ncbi:hypothetical protein GW17_00035945 [Ensete ventricosum]|nr:hypothetical protein GW17_00035945 [Ensete ventricosum]RZS27150.1 hypothetical protein BHM03_00060585 [Ensete ventricosum]